MQQRQCLSCGKHIYIYMYPNLTAFHIAFAYLSRMRSTPAREPEKSEQDFWEQPHEVALPWFPGLHTYIHTYTHTYIHTYIHTYLHTCIRKTYKQRVRAFQASSSAYINKEKLI
jgi:hypothetical protein